MQISFSCRSLRDNKNNNIFKLRIQISNNEYNILYLFTITLMHIHLNYYYYCFFVCLLLAYILFFNHTNSIGKTIIILWTLELVNRYIY